MNTYTYNNTNNMNNMNMTASNEQIVGYLSEYLKCLNYREELALNYYNLGLKYQELDGRKNKGDKMLQRIVLVLGILFLSFLGTCKVNGTISCILFVGFVLGGCYLVKKRPTKNVEGQKKEMLMQRDAMEAEFERLENAITAAFGNLPEEHRDTSVYEPVLNMAMEGKILSLEQAYSVASFIIQERATKEQERKEAITDQVIGTATHCVVRGTAGLCKAMYHLCNLAS